MDRAIAQTLGSRIRAMRADPQVRKALARCATLPLGLRRPLISAALARLGTDNAVLARLLVAGEPVAASELPRALDASVAAALRALTVLVDDGDDVRSTAAVPLDGDEPWLVPRRSVGGPLLTREDAANIRFRDRRFANAVYLGVGNGALRLARTAERTWWLRAPPEARALAATNAALDGSTLALDDPATSVDRLALDLIDDLVAATPAPMHDGFALLRRLGEDGVATIVLQSADPAARAQVQANLPADARVVWLDLPPIAIDEACALAAAELHPELGQSYEEAFGTMRSATRSESMHRSAILVVRARGSRAWTVTRKLREARFSELRMADMFASADLAKAPIDELLAARVRFPEGTRLREGGITLPFAEPFAVARPMLDALRELHEAPDIAAAMNAVATRSDVSAGKVATQLVPLLRDALRDGLVEVAQ